MKKMLLFIAAALMMTITAQANEIDLKESNDSTIVSNRYRVSQPVVFTLNNIQYSIYSNGTLDYKLPRSNARSTSNRRCSNFNNRSS